MKKAKQFLIKSPEYYLIILIILSAYTPPFSFNPIFLGITIIPILQILFKNRISGIVIGSLFLLANLFFLAALISEFNEFVDSNTAAHQLIVVGLSVWILNMLASSAMIYKNVTIGEEQKSQKTFI